MMFVNQAVFSQLKSRLPWFFDKLLRSKTRYCAISITICYKKIMFYMYYLSNNASLFCRVFFTNHRTTQSDTSTTIFNEACALETC